MSVSLAYSSMLFVKEKHVVKIMREAEEFAASREWWSEVFSFFPSDFSDQIPKILLGHVNNWFDNFLLNST